MKETLMQNCYTIFLCTVTCNSYTIQWKLPINTICKYVIFTKLIMFMFQCKAQTASWPGCGFTSGWCMGWAISIYINERPTVVCPSVITSRVGEYIYIYVTLRQFYCLRSVLLSVRSSSSARCCEILRTTTCSIRVVALRWTTVQLAGVLFTHAGWAVGTQTPHWTISIMSRTNEHSPSQQRHVFPALGSPSRDGRVRHARSSTDDCGGRHLGGTKAWTKAPGATVADRKPLTERIPVPLMRPLLGNKVVHSINGNVNNLGSTLNEKNSRICTRKPPMYKCPCKACGKLVKSNQHGIFCDGCELWFHRRWCTHVSEAEYDRPNQSDQADETWYCSVFSFPSSLSRFSMNHPPEQSSILIWLHKYKYNSAKSYTNALVFLDDNSNTHTIFNTNTLPFYSNAIQIHCAIFEMRFKYDSNGNTLFRHFGNGRFGNRHFGNKTFR